MKIKNEILALDPNLAWKQIPANPDSQRFHKALMFLKRRCFEPIGVKDLMKASQLSRRGLHKAFQKYIGHGPGRELRRMRIERARELLAGSEHGLNVIAKMCGYRSGNSFWVSFREALGESPGKFRSRFRGSPVENRNGSHHRVKANKIATVILWPNTAGRIRALPIIQIPRQSTKRV